MEAHGIDAHVFAERATVRAADVEAWLLGQGKAIAQAGAAPPAPLPTAAEPDPTAQSRLAELAALLAQRRASLDAQFQRHVPLGTLLHDRWKLAAERGFGSGTSVYDECLILGDVVVGEQCWIGPFTVLDGSRARLSIGAHTQIGSGAHLYTHHTNEQALTGGRAPAFGRATTNGRCCFIAPLAVIGPGTELGDHSFVASGSYVEGHFPAFSYLAGAPAQRVGQVVIDGDRARLVRDES